MFLDCIYVCLHSAAVDPVVPSGNPAICRHIQTCASAPEPLTHILIHIPAPLRSLSRRYGPRISLPLQQGSCSPLKLTITDHLAWLHYKAMHVKSSHVPWPSHPISKYNPLNPHSISIFLSYLSSTFSLFHKI